MYYLYHFSCPQWIINLQLLILCMLAQIAFHWKNASSSQKDCPLIYRSLTPCKQTVTPENSYQSDYGNLGFPEKQRALAYLAPTEVKFMAHWASLASVAWPFPVQESANLRYAPVRKSSVSVLDEPYSTLLFLMLSWGPCPENPPAIIKIHLSQTGLSISW